MENKNTCKECKYFKSCVLWNYSYDTCPLFDNEDAEDNEA
jgi:hypothetical protein